LGQLSRTTPISLTASIAAAIQSGQARLLAEPSLRVIDGRSALIFIGDTLTIVISRDVTPTGTSIQTRDFHPGITLASSVRTTPDGDITLDINPTVSSLTTLQAQGTDLPLPQIRTRTAQTTVRLTDGDTMVLGGLLQDEDIKNMTKVPGLGDLPFFGNLFRSRSITKRHSEVVIFLTVHLIKS
jgi:type II secretory pathway component GspD/PulD (secretin)